MASWEGLRNYIKSNYVIGVDELDMLGLDFALDGGRTQKVIVSRMNLGDSEWVEIATPVCNEGEIAPRDALLRSGDIVVGGLILREGTVYFRHSLPLKDLDIDEFEVPFHIAVSFGDKLEREIVGVDRY
jgi:hypothetical protein